MKLWKRNAVVAAIVLFVCVAVYLNWSYSQSEAVLNEDPLSTSKTLGEAALVGSDTALTLEDGEETLAKDSKEEDAETGEEKEDEKKEGETKEEDKEENKEDGKASANTMSTETTDATEQDYFATARLNREEARDSALSILQETVDNPDANADTVSAATESITAMATATMQESEIENLVTSKGYPDCVAFIGDSSVSVVVAAPEGDLAASDIARITDIVCGETDFSATAVKVIQAEG